MYITELTTEEQRTELARRGYAVRNLWQIEDVNNFLEDNPRYAAPEYGLKTDEEKLEFMNDILTADGIQSDIQDHFDIVGDLRLIA